MKTIRLFALAAALLLISKLELKAQDYKNAIGLRGGYWSGVTFKHINAGNKGFELILSPRFRGFGLTGLYEIHKNAFSTPRLNWYYGVGGHVSNYNYAYYYKNKAGVASAVGLGANGIIGLEYNFQELPINVSVDLMPTLPLVPFFDLYIDGAFSIRYYF